MVRIYQLRIGADIPGARAWGRGARIKDTARNDIQIRKRGTRSSRIEVSDRIRDHYGETERTAMNATASVPRRIPGECAIHRDITESSSALGSRRIAVEVAIEKPRIVCAATRVGAVSL